MREFVFFFLYGMLTLTGLFLCGFWGRITKLRVRSLAADQLIYDRYFWLAFSLALNSFGSVVLFGARTWSNTRYGLSSLLYGIEGLFIGLGLTIVLFAKIMMVWLADLESIQPMWLWGMGAITLLWVWVCLALVYLA